MRSKPFILLALLLLAAISPLYSGQVGEAREVGNIGEFFVEPRLTTWGGYINFCLRLNRGLLEGRDTIFRISCGSVITWIGYYRDEDDRYTKDRNLNFIYSELHSTWGLGIEQGLLWNHKTNRNLLSLFLKYRTMRVWKFDAPWQESSILFDSSRPDRHGVLYNTFIASLIYDNILFSRETGLFKGLFAELSAEIAPPWFFNNIVGISDFTKIFANVRYFHPIYESRANTPIRAIYLANSIGLDYSFGNNIPLYVRQTYGINRHIPASGGMVRGFENRRFDSEIKIINNFDIRFIMPKVKTAAGRKILRPGFLAFFDICYFDKLEGYGDSDSGVLMSAGISIFTEIPLFGNILLTAGVPIIGERIDENPVAVSINLGFRF
ncbi:MAG: hypothetical protein FWC36_03250 [Spirochaetes bacterium]|nr:hypothetical protein [Spirochaetota bacterium]